MKRRSRVSGDLGGKSFLAYGSSIISWEIFSAYGGDTAVSVYAREPYSRIGTCQWHPLPTVNALP
jgi:hypothetical protein